MCRGLATAAVAQCAAPSQCGATGRSSPHAAETRHPRPGAQRACRVAAPAPPDARPRAAGRCLDCATTGASATVEPRFPCPALASLPAAATAATLVRRFSPCGSTRGARPPRWSSSSLPRTPGPRPAWSGCVRDRARTRPRASRPPCWQLLLRRAPDWACEAVERRSRQLLHGHGRQATASPSFPSHHHATRSARPSTQCRRVRPLTCVHGRCERRRMQGRTPSLRGRASARTPPPAPAAAPQPRGAPPRGWTSHPLRAPRRQGRGSLCRSCPVPQGSCSRLHPCPHHVATAVRCHCHPPSPTLRPPPRPHLQATAATNAWSSGPRRSGPPPPCDALAPASPPSLAAPPPPPSAGYPAGVPPPPSPRGAGPQRQRHVPPTRPVAPPPLSPPSTPPPPAAQGLCAPHPASPPAPSRRGHAQRRGSARERPTADPTTHGRTAGAPPPPQPWQRPRPAPEPAHPADDQTLPPVYGPPQPAIARAPPPAVCAPPPPSACVPLAPAALAPARPAAGHTPRAPCSCARGPHAVHPAGSAGAVERRREWHHQARGLPDLSRPSPRWHLTRKARMRRSSLWILSRSNASRARCCLRIAARRCCSSLVQQKGQGARVSTESDHPSLSYRRTGWVQWQHAPILGRLYSAELSPDLPRLHLFRGHRRPLLCL